MLGLLRTLKVGMVASLSGSFSEQGRQALQGAMAWMQEVNGAGGIPIKELSDSTVALLNAINEFFPAPPRS